MALTSPLLVLRILIVLETRSRLAPRPADVNRAQRCTRSLHLRCTRLLNSNAKKKTNKTKRTAHHQIANVRFNGSYFSPSFPPSGVVPHTWYRLACGTIFEWVCFAAPDKTLTSCVWLHSIAFDTNIRYEQACMVPWSGDAGLGGNMQFRCGRSRTQRYANTRPDTESHTREECGWDYYFINFITSQVLLIKLT